MVLVLVHRFPNKQNHPRAICPNVTNRPRAICPNETNRPHAICPNETVGAAPVCPPERPRSGVSIQNIHAFPSTTLPRVASYRRQPWADKSTSPTGLISPHSFTHEDLTENAPLWGDAGGHTGTAPTNLRYTFTHTSGRECIAHSRPHYLK